MALNSQGTGHDALDDAHLVGKVARGDRAAFTRLFDRLSPTVLGFLVRMIGDRAEAEEILQEVFLEIWEGADRYDGRRGTPMGWILVIARSRALDRIRSHRSRRRREERVGADPGRREEAPLGTERLESVESRRRLGAGLASLPEEQRICIELAYFEGLTHSQIAARLQAPLGTVKSRVLLGMRKLREALAA